MQIFVHINKIIIKLKTQKMWQPSPTSPTKVNNTIPKLLPNSVIIIVTALFHGI
jgi:hypothetical protein